MHKQSITVRMARWSATHPWRAIVGWLVFVVLCVGLSAAVGTNSAVSADYRVGEAGRAEALLAEGGLTHPATEQILIDSASGPLDRAAADAAARDIVTRMRALPEVERVDEPVVAPDGQAQHIAVAVRGEELTAQKKLDPLLAVTAAVQRDHPGVRVQETGRPSMSRGLNDQRASDLALSEALTLPVTLVVLLVAFGSIIAAGVPILLAISSIMAAMGLAGLASYLSPDAGVGNNVILLIGMAVGVDYSLFYLKRVHEEQARSHGALTPAGAVEAAAATAGRAIVVAGMAVVVTTTCLFLATDVIFNSLAIGTILVVLVAMASSLTVLPALLAKIGHRGWRRRNAAPGAPPQAPGRFWQRLLWPALHRPVLTLVVATAGIALLSLPALGLRIGVPGSETFSRSIPAVQSFDRLTDAFPQLRVVHRMVVSTPTAAAPDVTAALRAAGERARADARFAPTAPVQAASPDGRVHVLDLAVPHRSDTPQARTSLDFVRQDLASIVRTAVPGAEVVVTGDIARSADYLTHQNDKLALVVGLLLILTFLVGAIAFRSVLLGLIGIVLNLMSAGAAFGLLVLVFQRDWAQDLLGFTSTGFIGSRVPLFLFVILFGLSMDYQVFVVSRIREAVLRGVPARQAVAEGIVGSARVVTSAAIVMVTVFASFMFLSLVEMKQMGFGLAVAVLLDAVVVRVVILPALLMLCGDAAWWPSRAVARARTAPSQASPGDIIAMRAAPTPSGQDGPASPVR
ncbi:MAG TPA: MMPL family transporter [Pilimelia sp.]|nr:MMPL family transporter [Pilimelia sp.]